MITLKLEKTVSLYRNQFEDRITELHGCHRLERLSIELDHILFKVKYMVDKQKDLDKLPSMKDEFVQYALELRQTFGSFLVDLLDRNVGYDDKYSNNDLIDVLAQSVQIDAINVTFDIIVISSNREYLEFIDNMIPDGEVYNLNPSKFFRFYTDSYNDGVSKAYPELFEVKSQDTIGTGKDADIFCHTFTFQTSENCSLNCFPASTKVLMADGSYKDIETIEIGDMVMSVEEHPYRYRTENLFDEEVRTVKPTKVIRTFKSTVDQLYSLKIKDEYDSDDHRTEILSTGNHEFLIRYGKNSYWQNLDKLDKGVDDLFNVYSKEILYAEDNMFKKRIDWRVGYEKYFDLTQLQKSDQPITVYNFETEAHTYIISNENLIVHNCTYCYQFNKSNMRMDFETAKAFVDKLLNDEYGYINRYNSPAIILEFIGGEPLMEINLTRRIYEYFLDLAYDLNHPWFKLHRLSICSNGLQYFDDEVQDFFRKYAGNISFNISIDGNKELHDSCRIQPNGEGSYDIDMMALKHYTTNYAMEKNSKMTLAPENIHHLFESVVYFINSGMQVINLNCVFEEGWTQKTALTEYQQLKKLADHILDNDLEHLYIAIFNERQEDVQDKSVDGNFCFTGEMTAATPTGSKYIKDINIGDRMYTASGSVHQVTEMYYGKDSTCTVKVDGLAEIECTRDHKFYSNINNEYDFREISKLSVGDLVWSPLLKFNDECKYRHLNTLAYVLGIYIAIDGYLNRIDSKRSSDFFLNAFTSTGLSFDYIKCDDHPYAIMDKYIILLRDNSITLNSKFFRYADDAIDVNGIHRIPRQIFESDVDTVRLFVEGYIDTLAVYSREDSRQWISIYDDRIRHDIMLLGRSSGVHLKQNPYDNNQLIYDPKLNVDDLNRLPDGYWMPIISIDYNSADVDVYCPTVMPLTNDGKEEHSIILGSLGASQCGGSGSMLSLRPNGEFYPCIRYMPTSVGDDRMNLCMGTVESGMLERSDDSEILKLLDSVTRRSQMNDICYDCPIGNDCASCSALSHTVYGTPNKRTSFACIQMIAEALANVYYWNLLNLKHPEYNLGPRYNNVPEEWALLVIDKQELDYLYSIETRSALQYIENNIE